MKSRLILMCLAATIAVACSEHSVSESNGWNSTYLLTPGDSDNTTGREDSNGQFTLSKYGQEKGTEEPEVETRNTSNEGKDHSVGFAAMANTTEKKEEPISADSHELERVSERDHLGSLNATEPTTAATTAEPTTVFSTTEPTTAATTAEPTIVFSTTEPTTAATTAPQRCQHSDPWATCANPSSEDKAKLAEALTEFALRFYKTVISSERDDSNVVFSPLSVAVALSHLLLGARDETKRDLEMLLSYPEDFTCVHAAMKLLVKSEALISASTIFFHKDLNVTNVFLNQSQWFYNSRPMQLSSNNTYNLQSINKWVSDQTKDKIKRLLDDLSPDVQMVLLSAVYFHSKWKTPFKVKNTLKEEFYRPGLGPIKVPMMTSKKYPLASFTDRNLQVKVGQLQLSHDMSLVVIMPQNAVQNLLEVEKRLDVEVFKAVMGRLETTPLKPTVVCLPKFKVDSTQDLMAILGEMKYGVFFNTNLCGISEKEELEVSGARHRAVLELNEEGVEAAAATAISVARTAWFFEVQRPFLFVLWNNNAKFPVFMGRINDPTA